MPERARSPIGPADDATPPVEQFLDQLVAEELEWRQWVRRYPKSALVAAAIGGFLLGRARGREILAALGAYAVDTMTDGINEYIGRDLV